MRLLRPLVTNEHEALLLLRLCADEALSDDPRKRPLTVGEIGANWDMLRPSLQARYALSEDDAAAALGECRAAWREADAAGWARAHAQYPAVLADVREAAAPSLLAKPTVYVLAARAELDDVHAMLERQSIQLPPSRVLRVGGDARQGGRGGFGQGGDGGSGDAGGDGDGGAPSKADVLAALRREHPTAEMRYVDDDAQSLRAVADDTRLFSLSLHFAQWGYSSPAGEASVAAMPRVRALTDSRQLEDILKMPRKDGMGFKSKGKGRRPPRADDGSAF